MKRNDDDFTFQGENFRLQDRLYVVVVVAGYLSNSYKSIVSEE